MNLHYIKLLIAIILFSTSYVNGQFTYLEAGLNNTNVLYESPSRMNSNTHYHGLSFRISAVSRFIRNVGVGGELNVPLAQSNGFSFTGSDTQNDDIFLGFEDAVNNNRYVPQEIDYSFKNVISGSLFGRIYLSTILNPYVDVKISFVSVKERFIFKRAEIPAAIVYGNYIPKIPASDIEYEMKHKLFVPGFAIGLQPHVSEKLFINFNFGMDFYSFKGGGFSYPLVFDYDGFKSSPKIVNLESKASNTKAAILINLGVGYFF